MSSYKKFTFAISSPDEFLVLSCYVSLPRNRNTHLLRYTVLYLAPFWVFMLFPGVQLSGVTGCRKDAQPVPKGPRLHRSGWRDKHNCPWPLTPQPGMLPLNHCDLQWHVGMNNLPKVVTRQPGGRESNPQPPSCQSDALTTRLPSHPRYLQNKDEWRKPYDISRW